jgi:hypothetical protein
VILTVSSMRALAWPTGEQEDAFVEQLCWAHSWYKHLDPDEPGQFVVFLSDGAGGGFEDRDRLHHGWKSTVDYRRQFGLLDYAWRQPGDEAWRRDGLDPVAPSDELLAIAGFRLAPVVSNDGNAIEVICSLFADHAPYRELVDAYVEERADLDAIYERLRAPEVAKIKDALFRLRRAML